MKINRHVIMCVLMSSLAIAATGKLHAESAANAASPTKITNANTTKTKTTKTANTANTATAEATEKRPVFDMTLEQFIERFNKHRIAKGKHIRSLTCKEDPSMPSEKIDYHFDCMLNKHFGVRGDVSKKSKKLVAGNPPIFSCLKK